MIRFLVPVVCLVLFFVEPIFGLFSPLSIGGALYYIVPRFLILFLIFLTVFYELRHALFYGLFFGLLYDVFYIDIIGLYSFLYPAVCLIAAYVFKKIPQNLLSATLLALGLLLVMEVALYLFFLLIGLTAAPAGTFLTTRLWPTLIANSLYLGLVGWVFRSMMVTQDPQRENRLGLY
ncbi:rod shape-determining protein MreD [Planococcus dechangensis]|uniref:Rod shape-determining protein MreD n=1 Tax=Planococcus dechangensis TaxID=1176255 RepID=A0ABV9MA65_9BACL